jgi:hypothetical protein
MMEIRLMGTHDATTSPADTTRHWSRHRRVGGAGEVD